MSQIVRSALLLALLLSLLAVPVNSVAEPERGQAMSEEYYREAVPACKQDFSLPEVHTLPTGVGDVAAKRCFNNGFTTIPPHTRRIGSCLIAAKSQAIIDRGNIAYDQSCLDRHPGLRHPEKCEVNCKDTPKGLKGNPECTPEQIKLIRRKYYCRFKGAGAVLGQTGEIRESGSKIFFRGEEPENFTTKDPNCQKIFQQLFTKANKYGYLK